jgi:hypothetical protein
MILKIFSPKNSAKKLAFLTQNKGKLCKIVIITLVFEKNAIFFAENWRKSQKIVIVHNIDTLVTLVDGLAPEDDPGCRQQVSTTEKIVSERKSIK